eukprot:scaffold24926_cov67-Phaeocystis_antarctica.AAC.3
MATGVRLQTCSRHALQRLELLVRVGLGLGLGGYRLALLWLQACNTQRRLELPSAAGSGASSSRGYGLALLWLQVCSRQRCLELPWLRASTTSSTTMVAGLQQAAAPRAPVAIG